MVEYDKNNYRILIVDDDEVHRILLKEMLESKAIIDECANGVEALGRIHHAKQYDLVITDINMPFLSGIELAKICNYYFPELSFILTSISADAYLTSKINIPIVKTFLPKPIKEKVLLGFVDGILFGMI